MVFENMEGLLFYLSGKSFSADFARGQKEPTFSKDVSLIEDTNGNKAIQCEDRQRLAWKASNNIYAKRGTLSFFWRARYDIGSTEFPLFRVGFADHTSWDQSWLRIDYSAYGFDAMITDRNLARARVSYKTEWKPAPSEWVHFALAWDQEYGIKFYINGKFVGEEYRPGIYDCGLDSFGPHGRSISNWSVCNEFNFIRGGDIREIVIYDRMLDDSNIERLFMQKSPTGLKPYEPIACQKDSSDNWSLQNGFRKALPTLPDYASVRKVEIHDAYDIKRWYWKACDGIRETTWPGVHNRSRLKGRNDYYQLPDWDCYSLSGKEIAFTMPKEDFNWIEIAGSAHGKVSYIEDDSSDTKRLDLFNREGSEERTIHIIDKHNGGKVIFTNDEMEEPIGDFSVFNVKTGDAPTGIKSESFYLSPLEDSSCENVKELTSFISGRFPQDERCMLIASRKEIKNTSKHHHAIKPFYEIVVPYAFDETVGLDGIEFEFPDDKGEYALSIQVKDPLWYYRNLMQITFKKLPSNKRLWLDTRDRILPENKCLYITIASEIGGLDLASLLKWKIRLVYKDRESAKIEHCEDRFTQVRDLYGHLVEEAPKGTLFNMYNRFVGDINDLMKVSPDHIPGQYYLYERDLLDHGMTKFPGVRKKIEHPEEFFRPQYDLGEVPDGIPAWAWWQVYYLKRYKYVVNWYIDNRQIFNGEFGGGLSDDGDFTSDWVGLALMGCNPKKIIKSVENLNDCFYNQGMFTNGLCSIQADELHSSEEGLTCLAQCCAVDFGNPKYLERAMENVRAGYWITGINKAGHRHFKSSYFSGSKISRDMPWAVQQAFSGIALSPAWFVARFNHNEKTLKLLTELADGIVAHYDSNTGLLEGAICYETDEPSSVYTNGVYTASSLQGKDRGNLFTLWPAYRLTGNRGYYDVLNNKFKQVDVCYVGECNTYDENNVKHLDKEAIAKEYKERCYHAAVREYYNTLGSPWIDRVEIRYQEIQYDRLGGIGYERRYAAYPRNMVSWRFERENDDECVAILSPLAMDNQIKLIICNISNHDVPADLLGGEMSSGIWSYSLGIDNDDSDSIENEIQKGKQEWYRMEPIHMVFPAGKTCILEMKLETPLDSKDKCCDLGISKDDLKLWDHGLNVKVHSLGYVPSLETEVVLRSPAGDIVMRCELPALDAPSDLYPKTWEVIFNTWQIPDLTGYTIEIDPGNKLNEVTRINNTITIDKEMFEHLKKGLFEARRVTIF